MLYNIKQKQVTIRQEFTQMKRELLIWKTEVKEFLEHSQIKEMGWKIISIRILGESEEDGKETFQTENDQEFSRNEEI